MPILQRNIPRALGAKDTLLELIIDEIKSTPYVMKDFKTTLKLASEGELKVQMSPMQLAWIGKEVRAYLRPFVLAFAAMLGAIFLLLYDPVLKEAAAIMFATAMAVLIYKK